MWRDDGAGKDIVEKKTDTRRESEDKKIQQIANRATEVCIRVGHVVLRNESYCVDGAVKQHWTKKNK
jgi:hypothetical protein